ncbi:MAG TPA: 50S ribosomal protein L13 [bacterium]|nr:50S ribosomal protein L13 [bacterium]
MTRQVHKIDATGKAVGRLASHIAILLRGKHKTSFVPNLDEGDIVEVSNVELMKITGKKLEQKVYRKHSGFPGGLKEVSMKDLMAQKPFDVLRNAVSKMLPKVRFRDDMMKRLKQAK